MEITISLQNEFSLVPFKLKGIAPSVIHELRTVFATVPAAGTDALERVHKRSDEDDIILLVSEP